MTRPGPWWWSDSVGLLTLRDGVYWRHDAGFTSLRHEGLPNELPTDAVQLVPLPLANRDEP